MGFELLEIVEAIRVLLMWFLGVTPKRRLSHTIKGKLLDFFFHELIFSCIEQLHNLYIEFLGLIFLYKKMLIILIKLITL